MGLGLLVSSRFHDHTYLRHTTVGRTPLDEGPAHRRDLYLTTHNTHNRQTFYNGGDEVQLYAQSALLNGIWTWIPRKSYSGRLFPYDTMPCDILDIFQLLENLADSFFNVPTVRT
jgi:hypothetical protein